MAQPTAGDGVTPPTRGQPRRIADFDDLVQLFPDWTGRFEQLSRGRFDGTIQAARGRTMYAHRAAVNQSLRVRVREAVGVLSLALVLPDGAGCLWQGRRLDAGRIVVRGGDVEADHRTSKRAAHLQLSMREDQFRRAVIGETGDDPGPMGWHAVHPSPERFAALTAAVCRFLAASPDGGGMEQACLAAAVAAVVPAAGRTHHAGLSLAARAGLVRRAEDYLRDRLRTPTTEAELCRHLGVPGRTLRLAFREQVGLGPMGYLQTLRLNAVRAALKRGDPEEAPVARIAWELGFQHPGKFAGYYRRLFGELPSRTAWEGSHGRGGTPVLLAG